ncbi:uncharacterized protein HMPREF1541_04616, partial [Cyphellophora europaea CBS 101466]
MGRSKAEKKGEGIQQRHLHSRLSYLHQAATYLSTAPCQAPASNKTADHETDSRIKGPLTRSQDGFSTNESRHLLTHVRGISRKTQIRVARDMKRSLCKRCQSLLVAGSSSTEGVQNLSIDESKPWADVFEIYCSTCGTVKRFPIGQTRTRRKDGTKELPRGSSVR